MLPTEFGRIRLESRCGAFLFACRDAHSRRLSHEPPMGRPCPVASSRVHRVVRQPSFGPAFRSMAVDDRQPNVRAVIVAHVPHVEGTRSLPRSVRSRSFRSQEKRGAGVRHGVGLGAPTPVPRTVSRNRVFPTCGAACRERMRPLDVLETTGAPQPLRPRYDRTRCRSSCQYRRCIRVSGCCRP